MGNLEGARIYFSPCGIGLGHVGRTLPIADELRSRGSEVMFSTYLEGVDYVRRRGFPVVSAPAFNLQSDYTGRIDLRASAVTQGIPAVPRFLRQISAEMDYMKAFKPDLIFSDSRLSSVVAGKMLGLPVALMLNQFLPMVPRGKERETFYKLVDGGIMTVLGKGWAASDVILIPDFPEPYTISFENLRIPKAYRRLVRMVGFILPRKPRDVEDTGRVREEAHATGGETLIYAAISGPERERVPLINLLRPILEGFPPEFRVLMSTGDPDGGSKPTTSGSLTTVPWVVDRYEYLKACDLILCRGGHNTIMQSICYGKPSIIIPTPNHTEQISNARRAREMGVAEMLPQEEISGEGLLRHSRSLILDTGVRTKLDEINSLGLSNGLENSLAVISDLISRS